MATVLAELLGDVATDRKGVVTATRKFLVQTAWDETADVAIGAISIRRWDRHPTQTAAMAQAAKATARDDMAPGFWIVDYEYSTETEEKKDGDNNQQNPQDGDKDKQPDLRPWTISMDSVSTTELLAPLDKAGVKVTASNGQPFIPAIEVPGHRPTITISGMKPIAAVDSILHIQTFHNKVNLNPWTFTTGAGLTRFAAKTVRVTKDSWKSVYEQNQFWWQFDISLEIKFDGWNPIKVVDMGTYEKVSLSLPPRPIMVDGQPVTSPVPLNGAGMRLADLADLHYLEFQGYGEVDFALMI